MRDINQTNIRISRGQHVTVGQDVTEGPTLAKSSTKCIHCLDAGIMSDATTFYECVMNASM